MSFAIAAIVKVTLALLLALGAAALFRRVAAATRHTMLVAGQVAALTMPLLGFVVPHVKVDVAPMTPRAAAPFATPRTRTIPTMLQVDPPATSGRNIVVSLWALGVLAIAAKRALGIACAVALVRRGRPMGSMSMHDPSMRNVSISDEVEQPVTFGSRIVLPAGAIHWHEARLQAVLAHERAHVERRDSLQAAIGDAVCAIYWFHPLAWLAAKRAALAREQACDDAVLAQGITRDTYATAILDVARSLSRRAAHGLPMATRSQLEVRLRAILADRPLAPARSARFAVIAAALACAPLLAALTPRGIEPDLLGDAYASPYSERIAIDAIPVVAASGPDAPLIAKLQELARRPPENEIDFVSDRARWALAQVRDGELLAPLVASLDDADWRIRAYAAWGLAAAADRRTTRALLPLLDDRVWRVRSMAATALADIADPAAAPAMQRALADDAWQVRQPAVAYFRAIGAERALFLSMTNDRHVAVRTTALEALQ